MEYLGMKNKIFKIKSQLGRINRRLDIVERNINIFKDIVIGFIKLKYLC